MARRKVMKRRRKPGRPPKNATLVVKRGPGRPPKNAALVAKRKPGRPPKNATLVAKRKPGRPPKNATLVAKRKPGRPPKNAALVVKRKPVRPPKNAALVAKRKPGRPPKNATLVAKRKPGRPPKNAALVAKRKPGRPPKAVVIAGAAAHLKPAGVSNVAVIRRGLAERRARWHDDYLRCLQSGFAPDPVHDLRVATRRLLAKLDLLKRLLGGKFTAKAIQRLRKPLKRLRELRDLQVQENYAREAAERFPALTPYLARLTAERQELQALMKERLDAVRFEKCETALSPVSELLGGMKERPNLAKKLIRLYRRRHRRVMKRMAVVRATEAASFHRVRVAFKHCRYLAEILSPLTPRLTHDVLHQMRLFQSLLGEIQDLEMAQQYLAARARIAPGRRPAGERRGRGRAVAKARVRQAQRWRKRQRQLMRQVLSRRRMLARWGNLQLGKTRG